MASWFVAVPSRASLSLRFGVECLTFTSFLTSAFDGLSCEQTLRLLLQFKTEP